MKTGDILRSPYKPGQKSTELHLRRIEVIAQHKIKANFRDGIHLGIELNDDLS